MIELVPIQYYTVVFYWVMFALCILTSLYYMASPGCNKLLRHYSLLVPLLLTIILIVYIGLRPYSWAFVDMMLYRHKWGITDPSASFYFGWNREWFFDVVLIISKNLVADVQFWFFVVELFYIGCQFIAVKKLLWENVWLSILFVFFSFQFFTYGTNGIRNGMGTGLMMLTIAFFCDRKKMSYLIGVVFFVLAMGCHRSVMIPMAALMVSLFWGKDLKYAIYIWLACIIISLVAGNSVQSFFSGLGFDDRMERYSNANNRVMNQFSHVGFRWDFLLYSAMPVWLAWYVRYKGIFDKTFSLLASTYIIANSFWILVIRVAFSNRFAYLSWFMYALVIAYAVVRVPIWKDQDRRAGQILLAHSAFTMFMHLFG